MSVSSVPTEGARSPGELGRPTPWSSHAAPSTSLASLAQRVRSEYHEMPGLSLTRDQACCLWGIDAELCERVLAHLVDTGFLTRTSHATYVWIGG